MARKDLNLREWLGLLLIALVMVASAVLSIRNTEELAKDAQWVAHTLEVKNQVHEVEGTLLDAQNSTRAFIITGDQQFLQRRDRGEAQLYAGLKGLRALSADNAAQQAALDSIEPAAKVIWQLLQERTRRVIEQGGRSIHTSDIEEGEQRMDDLRRSLVRFSAREDVLLHERESARADTQQWGLITALLAAACGVLLLLIFTSNLIQANAKRAREVAEAFEREQWFRTTLASIGDAVVTTDAESRITYLNAVAEELTGWKNTEAAGQPLHEVFRIINEFSRKTVANPAYKAIQEGVIVGLANHTILIAKDGTEHHIDDSAAPIKDNQGRIIGCVLIFRDIGERRSSEAAATQLAAIVASSDDAIISKNLQGIIQTWNTAAERLFGYAAHEAVGQPATLLIPQDRQNEEPAILESIANGKMIDHYETVRRRKDGTLLNVSLTISPIRDAQGTIIGASKIARDITECKAIEATLTERDELLRTALESAQLGSWALDTTSGKFRSDERYKAIFGTSVTGLTEEEAIGNIHPDDQARVTEAVHAAMRPLDPVPYSIEYRVVHPDGSVHWVHAKGSAGYSRNGEEFILTRFAGTVADITERIALDAALKRSQERLRFVMDAMPQKVVTAKPNGELDYLSPEWMRFTGLTMEQIKDRQWQAVLHPDDLQNTKQRWSHSITTGTAYVDEYRVRRADGEYHWHYTRIVPMHDQHGVLELWVGASTDVHEQWSSAEKLRQLAADLSEADRRKNEFLAMLAHELRNPLAPIRNTIELLSMSSGDVDREAALRMMARQTDQLARLVDDLLDVSRVSQGKIALRTSVIDFTSVMRDAAESAKLAATAAGQTVDVVVPHEALHVNGDAARLKQVLDNLLNNAMKFTPNGGHITLRAERTNNEAVVTVQDNGIGIAPQEIGRIFDLFMQADPSPVQSTAGLGIGLTLVKNLVEMHGGSVKAQSEGEGTGAIFTVRLPIVNDVAHTPPAPERKAPAAQRKILVVDDNRDAAESLSMILTATGHNVRTAFDGLEAVATAAAFKPEVILLDIGLPNLNGYEVAKRIRKEAWGTGVYLVALTGWGQDEDRNKSSQAGFDLHLVKPVDLAQLRTLLARPLERKGT